MTRPGPHGAESPLLRSRDGTGELLPRVEALLHRCALEEALGTIEAALAPPAGLHPADAAELLLLQARVLIEQRRSVEAARAHLQALELARTAGSPELEVRAQLVGVALSLAVGSLNDAWSGLAPAQEALRGLTAPGDRVRFEFHRAMSHAHASSAHQREAVAEAELSLDAARRWGNPHAIAAGLGNLAGRWFAQGYKLRSDEGAEAGRPELQRSIAIGEQAVAAADALGSTWLNLANLNNLAGAATALQDDGLALATFARLDRLSEDTGLHYHRVHAAINFARLLRRRGELDRALEHLAGAERAAEAIQATRAVALLNFVAAEIHEERGDFRAALAAYKRYHENDGLAGDEHAETVARVIAVREAAETARREAAALRAANAALVEQSRADPLTGLANRRWFDEVLQAVLAEASRTGRARGSLALIDVDHFKRVNDDHSHALGDAVLRTLAAVLAQHCRDTDLAVRWGGDEFALLLHGLEEAQAVGVCERIRAAVEQHPWERLAAGLAVTVSVGVAEVLPERSTAAILAATDRALYRAKRTGRNRVCTASECTTAGSG